jgi:Cytochrome C oxidase, cbb3-type, subunit III
MSRPGRVILGTVLAAATCVAAAFARPRQNDDASALARAEHLAHVLAYLDADYARFGTTERAELLAMSVDGERLARTVAGSPTLAERVARIGALIERAAPTKDVHATVADLREELLVDHAIDRSPGPAPDLERGRVLYERHCASCHGVSGRADTLLAATLRPHPANLAEPLFGATISPYDVTTAVRFGVDGTAMAPIASLDAADRWDVAFYVVGLRHAGPTADTVPSFTPRELALVSDDELSDQLFAAGVGGADMPLALNALRRRAPFEPPRTDAFAETRRHLDDARVAIVRADHGAAVDAVRLAGSTGATADPSLAGKMTAAFARLRQVVDAASSPREQLDVLATTLGLLTHAEHKLGARDAVASAERAHAWPDSEPGPSERAETSAHGPTGTPCSDPGFTPGPTLHPTSGLPFEVTHDCMFPGNDRLEVVLNVQQPQRPARTQVDVLLRDLLAQVRSATGDRMPELTHISALSSDGKTSYGRLELDADEGPEGELSVMLQIPFEPSEWATRFATSHARGFLAVRPSAAVDASGTAIAITFPFVEAGTDAWSRRVTLAHAAIRLFPWLFDFYPPRTDLQAVTFTGIWRGRPVLTVRIADLRTFLTMDPWAIRERMAAAGIPIDPEAARTPAQEEALAAEYLRALAKLPKGSVIVDPTLRGT